jgi:hypothetical protein
MTKVLTTGAVVLISGEDTTVGGEHELVFSIAQPNTPPTFNGRQAVLIAGVGGGGVLNSAYAHPDGSMRQKSLRWQSISGGAEGFPAAFAYTLLDRPLK